MTSFEASGLAKFLYDVRWPELTQAQPTFFSIAGISTREVALSSTYAFFFRSDAPHGLGLLFTAALGDILVSRSREWTKLTSPVFAACEYSLSDGKRLDILVHNGVAERNQRGASFKILIENKINHVLNNDLSTYWDSISSDCFKIGVILGRRAERLPPEWASDWTYITHFEMAQAIEQRLGPAIQQASPRYLPVLLHFLEHLKRMSQDHEEFAQTFEFMQQHRQKMAQAEQLIDDFNAKSVQQLGVRILSAFGDEYTCSSMLNDRAHIRPKNYFGVEYLVWFGHINDLTKMLPSFSITLFCANSSNKTIVKKLRGELSENAIAKHNGISRLDWFSHEDWFDEEMIVGKTYLFVGKTLNDFETEVEKAVEEWKPLEPFWNKPIVFNGELS